MGDRNYLFAAAFVDGLARAGLRHVCLSPGSRSTPLVLAVAQHPDLRTWVHLDERSAAFFALGLARASREPVALMCTSGTAAANLFPAVVEARYGHIPLLVLTADRPPELWDWGANQTVNQTRMYGSHAKWALTMPIPEATPDLLRFAQATAARAYATALETPAGPVHLDFPFREPMVPESAPEELGRLLAEVGQQPLPQAHTSPRVAGPEEVQGIAAVVADAQRGVIICGPQDDPDWPPAVAALAERLEYPILADPLSQVRCGPHDRSLVIDSYDAFLRDAGLAQALTPEVVLRFGAAPTSKAMLTWLRQYAGTRHILVNDGAWPDPDHVATHVVRADAARFARDLAEAVGQQPATEWTQRWRDLASAARSAVEAEMEVLEELFEGKVFSELASLLPDGATLFAGNSMPVRDLDAFFPSAGQRVRVMANRGASGVDGVVSTALGAAALSGPLVLVVGDLSFYHDMNGLLAARQYGINATIIVLNNDGGGIFSFLPQTAYSDIFEPYFGTPHGLTFDKAAELYGLGYSRVQSWAEFHQTVADCITTPGTNIVEVPGDRTRNVESHRRVQTVVVKALAAASRPL